MPNKKSSKKSKKGASKASSKKKTGSRAATKRESGRLVLTLRDGRGEPITARARISIREEAAAGPTASRAEGKAGEVSRFTFDLPAGDYFVEVSAEGFKLYNQWVTVHPDEDSVYEFTLTLKEADEQEQDKKKMKAQSALEKRGGDEGHLLDGRFKWFAQQRLSVEERRELEKSLGAKQTDSFAVSESLLERFPSDARQNALEQKRLMPTSDEPAGPIHIPGCNWLSIGPRNINGRVRAMAVHPKFGTTVYAGSANAGVWVTKDAGQSWFPLMHDQGALEIGALCVHLTNPANPLGPVTIYAGTGEPTSWPGYAGVGVLKSVDSGATWNTTGAIGNQRFAAVLVDPTTLTANPATTTVYAGGTTGGLYKSTNGGGTWTLMLNKNIKGLAMDPVNPKVLYAACAFEGIFKYNPVTNTWSAFNTGFPAGFPQLILVDIGKSAPHTLYAKLDETVYKYNTVTSSWVSLGNHGFTTYGYWNNVLAVDPQNSNIVIAGGIVLERTFDGGTTWQPAGALHSDQHAAVFDSTNHLNIYAGNDGGVYRGTYTSPSDTGTWLKVSDGLILTQFNHIGVARAGVDVLGGGTQDNGTNRTTGGLTWDPILGADGGFFVVDPLNPYILYAEYQSGTIFKSTNGGASFSPANTGFPSGPWVTPIVLDPTSPVEPNRVLFAGGSNQVYRTTNSAGSWSPSSPNVGGEVIAIAIAPSSSAIVYAGTSGGRAWRSSDNGATMANWKNISVGTIAGSAPLPTRMVTDIVVHPTNPNIVFVVYSGFSSSTPAAPGHVFRGTSTDGWVTSTWKNISSTLPDIPVNAIQVHPFAPNTLYIGTDIGVFRTTDGGVSWTDFGAGLPNVVISDLALNSLGNTLRAATYGYGMFELDLLSTCPPVDVYVRDNKLDTGETSPSPSGVADPTTVGSFVYWWESADIKVDAFPYFAVDALFDGVEFDHAIAENPVRNDPAHPNPNLLYVQVHNRGPLPAHNVKVKALYANASAGLPVLPADFWATFPNNWAAPSAWSIVNAAIPFQVIPTLLPHTPKILTWKWNVPVTAADHTCMLVVISADEDPVVHSDANPNDHLVWMLVPNDKHITLRNLHVITAPAPGPAPAPQPITAKLDFHNPNAFPQFFDIVFDRGSLPNDARLSVLLPKLTTRMPLAQSPETGLEISDVTNREWWSRSSVKGLGKGWQHHARIAAGSATAAAVVSKVTRIPDVLIPAGKKVSAAVVIEPPPTAKPGSTFRFTVQQHQKGVLIGGSTYEIRIAPAEIKGGK